MHARSALSAAAGVAVLAVAAVGPAAPASGPTLGPPGTFKTVAGPGFCNGQAVLDSTPPARTRALAVEGGGTVFVDQESEIPGLAITRRFDSEGSNSFNSAIVPPRAPKDPLTTAAKPPIASRLAPDGRGGVYIAGAGRIVNISMAGSALATVTGDPASLTGSSSSGDGGPAELARFKSIRSVATDAAHNLYIADQIDSKHATFRIRFLNRSDAPVTFYGGTPAEVVVAPGNIDSIAGTDTVSASPNRDNAQAAARQGDGGPAADAILQGVPPAMAVSGDRLYVATYSSFSGETRARQRLRVINLGGTQATANGTAVGPALIETITRDSGPAGGFRLSYVPGIAADSEGAVYLADTRHHRVVKIDAGGRTTNFAGTGAAGFNGERRPARSAQLSSPYDVKAGPGGAVFISDGGNGRVRVVSKSGEIGALFEDFPVWTCTARRATESKDSPAAGSPPEKPSGRKLTVAEEPQTGRPISLAAEPGGEIYFVNSTSHRAMKLDARRAVTPLALPSGAKATAAAERPAGGVYLVDGEKAAIYLLNTTSTTVTSQGVTVPPGKVKLVVAGTRRFALAPRETDAPQPAGPVVLPPKLSALAVDGQDNLFAIDEANRRVLSLDAAGKVGLLAGMQFSGSPQGCCTLPTGIAVDQLGNLYVANAAPEDAGIWLINRSRQALRAHGQNLGPGTASRVAGRGVAGVGGEGRALETALYVPRGLAFDRRGGLFIADEWDHAVKQLNFDGFISTVIGEGKPGFTGDSLAGKLSRLDFPRDVTVDRCGNPVVADTGNDRVGVLNLGDDCPPLSEQEARDERVSGGGRSGISSMAAILGGAVLAGALLGAAVLHRRGGRHDRKEPLRSPRSVQGMIYPT